MSEAIQTEQMTITTLADLEVYSKGQVVRLPDFAEGQPFVARIKRPSMLALIKSGQIPNSLLKTAGELFSQGMPDVEGDDSAMGNLFELLERVAEACLMEPSYADLKAANMALSDDQFMFIFNYTQRGVKALEPFRKE